MQGHAAVDAKTVLRVWLVGMSIFFLVMPTGAFLAISSDIIQVSSVVLAFVTLALSVVATIDIGFGLPRDEATTERLGQRRQGIITHLIDTISENLWLIGGTILAKTVCVSAQEYSLFWLSHLFTFPIGILLVRCVDKFAGTVQTFRYLSVGADVSSAVRNIWNKKSF
jgi:hypothetical protein